MNRVVYWIGMFLLVFLLGGCADEKDEPTVSSGDGITQRSWTEGNTYAFAEGETRSFTFTAEGSWTATLSVPLCDLSAMKGGAGNQTLSLKMLDAPYSEAMLNIQVEGMPFNSTVKIKRKFADDTPIDADANRQMDEILKTYYLWNDEYKTLTPDFGVPYDRFLENTLMNMTTNTLDKKKYTDAQGTAYYRLFSFVQKVDQSLQSASRANEAKTKERTYGFTNFLAGMIAGSNNVFLCVQGVYPETPADKAGIGRGTYITKINGQALTQSNWSTLYLLLSHPSAGASVKVTDHNEKEYTMMVAEMPQNPVLISKVDVHGSHRIGYLCYDNFDAGFDDELFAAFKEFKNAGVTDLVVDLRYNGGGHVMSADMMASCIAGDACRGKVFASYRYNDTRMKALGNKRPEELFSYDSYANLGVSLAEGGLNLNRVYVLVGNATASASELVINSLKGIGLDVQLIGLPTLGKNVGMEGRRLTTEAGNQYLFYPITFQSYNAKGEGDYEHGFTPAGGNLIDEKKGADGYFNGYKPWGSESDPLYARALTLITGQAPALQQVVSTRTAARPLQVIYEPAPRLRGMLK